jgi:hypothetical protein
MSDPFKFIPRTLVPTTSKPFIVKLTDCVVIKIVIAIRFLVKLKILIIFYSRQFFLISMKHRLTVGKILCFCDRIKIYFQTITFLKPPYKF